MVSIFGTSRVLWCPDCEKDDKDHPKIGGKFDRDEITTVKFLDKDWDYLFFVDWGGL